MLEFFRRYQRYVFLIITIVTIISFSFFGTYSTLGSNTWREQVAFKAINGKEIIRSDVDEMALFLATDQEDKQLYGGAWGPNFLNDGVIRKDFLQTGLAQELIKAYQNEMQDELQKKLDKEKKYTLYTHPKARFLSVQHTWGYFAPEMNTYLYTLRSAQKAVDPDAFSARVNLFLAERKFPASALKQVLRYQERQYSWLGHDPMLDQLDLSLFGYHTVEDWFSPQFTRLISQFIINAAILAEQKGYTVSTAEVLADLIRNTDSSYQQNKDKPSIGVASPEEYFNEQLRYLGMDQSKAIKTWRQIMLFRRYFQDIGHASLVDSLAYQKFNDFAQESLTLDVYRLPPELRFGDAAHLQKFEAYLKAVAKPVKGDPLALPTQFLSVAEVSRAHPELVQKRYLIEMASANKKALQVRIGIKEAWNWEIEDSNWATLKKQFPDLGIKAGESPEERFAILDSLDSITRSKVDAFARAAIVDDHPEWLEKSLAEAKPSQMVVGLRPQGGKTPFEGLDSKEKRQELIQLLDQAPLGNQPMAHSKLAAFTADQQNYYRIKVVERAGEPEILTFGEANADGTLEGLKDQINEQHLDKLVQAIQLQKGHIGQEEQSLTKDQAASLRFYTYLKQIKAQLEQDPAQAASFTLLKDKEEDSNHLRARPSLASQWLLERTLYTLDRKNQEGIVNEKEAFGLAAGSWSKIRTPAHGDMVFFQVEEKKARPDIETVIANQTQQAYTLLSADAQRILMRQVLKEIIAKNAISLAYLKQPAEEPLDLAN